jgi:phosphatidylserine/phosphatidylglycerophosphate/cardiolipin synthase-like enzyme
MRRPLIALLLPVVAIALGAAWFAPGRATPQDGLSVYFSPNGGCTDAIIREIDGASLSVLVQAYSFTSAPIAQAILEAHKRGVDVTVVMDSSQRTAKYSSATFFRNQGVPVYIDDRHAIAHNKIILIDGKTIITGSFNFSQAAENRNAENLLVIDDKPGLVRAYRQNFDEHLQHSVEYDGLAREFEDDLPAPD